MQACKPQALTLNPVSVQGILISLVKGTDTETTSPPIPTGPCQAPKVCSLHTRSGRTQGGVKGQASGWWLWWQGDPRYLHPLRGSSACLPPAAACEAVLGQG